MDVRSVFENANFITIINSSDLKELIDPILPRVIRNIARYSRAPDVPTTDRRKHAGAFDKRTWGIARELKSPPGPLETSLGVLLGIALAIQGLFL